jgi:D-alanyl-D-alanine carboxypeptidase
MAKQQGEPVAAAPRGGPVGKLAGILLIAAGLLGAYPGLARHVAVAQYGPAYEAIVLDAQTGQVLRELNPDVVTYPASLTKMMTLYLTFEALNQGRLRLDQFLRVSGEAASRAPSKLGLVPGDSVPVRDLILGIVTKSANDAAVVLAEGLGGSEWAFAQQMTAKARQLGMTQTVYYNASGLPEPNQRTTARDIARLALALYHQFPREYRYFSTQEFVYRGEIMRNHNHLMEWYPGLDGIKTGYINASGFNLAASAVRNGHRLIGVIMGGRSARSRDQQMAGLLDVAFADLGNGTGASRPVMAMVPTTPAFTAAAPQVAAAAPRPTPMAASAPAAAAIPPAAATRPAPAVASTAAEGDAAGPRGKPGFLGNVASHLSPVAKAEAAPLAREAPGGEDWEIQLGAFHDAAAAEQAARHVAGVAAVKGKPHQIIAPAKGDREHLYRARLLHFTGKTAQAACAELHKKKIACTVVRPNGVKVASQ